MKGNQVPDTTSSATDVLKAGNRVVALGIAAIVAILLGAAVLLFANLPDANAFNAKVERIFVENDDLRDGIKTYSNWPTIPQLYVNGEFFGGCDIIREMYESGEMTQAMTEAGIPVRSAA